jgi:DNA replicative helicase MCM subunit Mcm2 (Cdc46/Mcm family)
VRRHGIHAELGGTPDELLKPIADKIRLVLEWAKQKGALTLSPNAKGKWKELYTALSVSEGGRFEAIVSRPEAQVIRMASVYSLLDRSEQVGVQHLEAAMALWQYCHASAATIFGGKQGSSLEDQLLNLLVTAREGLTRTDISAAFNNHKSQEAISEALSKLQQAGKVEKTAVKTHGRSAEKWYLTKREH